MKRKKQYKLSRIFKYEMKVFINDNKILTILCIIAVIIIILHFISLDLPEWWKHAGDLFEIIYQLSLAIIANLLFSIFQMYIPQRKQRIKAEPYIIRYLKKIEFSMDAMFEELTNLYSRKKKKLSEIDEEDIKNIIGNIKATDITEIQEAFTLRQIPVAKMIDMYSKDIHSNIDYLLNRYGAFLSEELRVLLFNIEEIEFEKVFNNPLAVLFGTIGIQGEVGPMLLKQYRNMRIELNKYSKIQ